jgi:uncharacterized protein (TIGR02246 family)
MRRLVLAGLLLIPAAAQAQSATPEQLPDQFVAAWNTHDIAAFEKLYTSDAIWLPSAEERTDGRVAILGEFAKVHLGDGWARQRQVTLAIRGKPRIEMLRPDVATIFLRMDFLAAGKVVPGFQRTLILVADKSRDGWRIAAGQLTKESPQRPADAERQVIQLEDQWREARMKGDTGFLERFYAPDLKLQTADGRVVDRNEDIALFASGDIKPEFIVHHDLKVRVSEDTAIVTGVDHLKGTYKGNPGEMWLRFTDVLVRRGDAWLLVAHQSTPATPPK